MSGLAKLQLVGPLFLLFAAAGAEGVGLALTYAPGSEALWYIHLNVFGSFRLGDDMLSTYLDTAHGQLYLIDLPLFLLACGGLYSERPLALAIASNLCFVHAVVLAYAGFIREPVRNAFLARIGDLAPPQLYLCASLLTCALLSFSASHVVYFRAIRQEHG
jgi:hypothetical protein